jgi:hypothetical protein
LRVDGISFEEDGDLISPWQITLAIARRAAERDPHRVLRHVEREEADARRKATYGAWYQRRGAPDDHIRAEMCAGVDEEHGRPVRALLREWCGADVVDLRAEISSLRQEAARAAALAQSGVELLRRHGHPRDANRLERELAELRRGVEPATRDPTS